VVDDKKNPIIHQRILRKGGLFVVINNETQEIKSFLGTDHYPACGCAAHP
jgi:hypothetical protein